MSANLSKPFLRSDAVLKDKDSPSYTEVVDVSVSGFKDLQGLFTSIVKNISQATNSREFVYRDLDPASGSLLCDSLVEHDVAESSHSRNVMNSKRSSGRSLTNPVSRLNFNSLTRTLSVTVMPTNAHECHLTWLRDEMLDWVSFGLMTPAEQKLLKPYSSPMTARFAGLYKYSRKEPDLLLRPNGQYHPSVVVEAGWSQSWTRLMDDVRLWIVGGKPHVNIVFLIKWSKKDNSNEVSGFVEVYGRDVTGNPFLKQRAVIFPANETPGPVLEVTWGELYGAYVPAGRNPNENLPLNIESLRNEGANALSFMNMVPST